MRIGVDLGGTKTEVVVLDQRGQVVFQKRQPSPRGNYAQTLSSIAALVKEASSVISTPATLGVGIPGVLDKASGRVRNASATWLNGMPLAKDLATLLGQPVRVANDADCFTVSEAVDGAGHGASVVFGVILGTGCGGGIAVNGRPLTGPNGLTGEWGHTPLPWPRQDERPVPACFCGKSGCLEQYLSGPGVSRDYQVRAGQHLDVAAIVERMRQGEAQAVSAWHAFIDRLARGLSQVINILDPDAIVIGGGLSNIDEIYAQLPASLTAYVLGGECITPIVKAHHGDASGVRGAAWLWPL
ncbi:ROK family protein [Gallaecimonas xiamenensis]|uniref:Fructokinase n=1 Tax=Gallaecimonas xiamenensis 3-C-1 TaxID=745411 RepID=K2JLR2_9GAMM|nr:ROK family protein [Gallaecimonas xiamenensis]EKE75357.1 fructokinase [Gallaecimonas xiamenensis 3-C-1]